MRSYALMSEAGHKALASIARELAAAYAKKGE